MTNKELEIYAALVLVQASQISEPFSFNWVKDRPGLQINRFGIEVTRAIDKKEAEQCKLDLKVPDCQTLKNANEYIENLKRPNEYRGKPTQLPNSERFSLMRSGGYDDMTPITPITLVVNSIHHKSRKFCSYPSHTMFSRRGLYVFDDELRPYLQNFDTMPILGAINESVFDVVFIHQFHKLVIVEKGKISPQEVLFNKIDTINTKCEVKRISGSPDYENYCERAEKYRHYLLNS